MTKTPVGEPAQAGRRRRAVRRFEPYRIIVPAAAAARMAALRDSES